MRDKPTEGHIIRSMGRLVVEEACDAIIIGDGVINTRG